MDPLTSWLLILVIVVVVWLLAHAKEAGSQQRNLLQSENEFCPPKHFKVKPGPPAYNWEREGLFRDEA